MDNNLQQQREEAARSAMLKALLGQQTPESQPATFAQHFAESAYPLQKNDMQFMPNMLGPLINLGYEHREQGMYPPAHYPKRYDFKP